MQCNALPTLDSPDLACTLSFSIPSDSSAAERLDLTRPSCHRWDQSVSECGSQHRPGRQCEGCVGALGIGEDHLLEQSFNH